MDYLADLVDVDLSVVVVDDDAVVETHFARQLYASILAKVCLLNCLMTKKEREIYVCLKTINLKKECFIIIPHPPPPN